MAERLTDKTAKTTTPASGDLVHIVDISDITSHADGTSYKHTIDNFLKGRAFITIQGCYTLKASGNESITVLETGDFVIYEDVAGNEMILATIILAITTVPADLRVSTKAANWLDVSAAL